MCPFASLHVGSGSKQIDNVDESIKAVRMVSSTNGDGPAIFRHKSKEHSICRLSINHLLLTSILIIGAERH